MRRTEPIRYIYRLRPGKGEEYDRHHAEVWTALIALLRETGIHDYSIWRHEEIVVCSLRTRDGYEATMARLAESEVQDEWSRSLGDLFEKVADDGGDHLFLNRVFRLEEE